MSYGTNRLRNMLTTNPNHFSNLRKVDTSSDAVTDDSKIRSISAKDKKAAESLEAPTLLTLTEEEIKELFYKEASPDSAALVAYFGRYRALADNPMDGSLLKVLKHHKVGKNEIEHYVMDVWWKKVAVCIFDDDVDPQTYVLYSLVVPHNTALTLSEDVETTTKELKKTNKDITSSEVLSKLSGYEISGRKDFGNVLRSILRRYPKVVDLLVPTSSRFTYKTNV